MSKHIVAFDVETTGLSFKDDYIIQLSAVKFDTDFNELDVFNHYIVPYAKNWSISEEAFGKHGLTKDFIAENGEFLINVASLHQCITCSYAFSTCYFVLISFINQPPSNTCSRDARLRFLETYFSHYHA